MSVRPSDRSADPARAPLDTTADVETPEHVLFRHRVAGPARRAVAWLVDFLIRAAIVALVTVLLISVNPIFRGEWDSATVGLGAVIVFLVEWGYYVLCESLWSGRTPGKRALGLRVVKEGGYPITVTDSVLRNLLRAADFLPMGYAAGLSVMIWDGRFRRLGDLVAGTMVVVEERARVQAALHIHPPPSLRELQDLPQRLPLDANDIEALELFLRREGTLSPALARELAEQVAEVFARRVAASFEDPVRFLQLLYHRATFAGDRAPHAHGVHGARRPF